MAKRRNKKTKIPEIMQHPGEGLTFEWEENAEELMRDHLNLFQIETKEEDERAFFAEKTSANKK